MNKKGIFLVLFAAIMSLASYAQGRMDMRINEVMVQNDSNYIDANGHRSAWIELFNASYGTNGIEQMFITTKKPEQLNLPAKNKNLKLQELAKTDDAVYEIPGGDVATDIAPRTHAVLFADGLSAGGALHLSFKLVPGQDNYIALYDVNGDLVDEVTVPASLPANCSYARKIDGKDSIAHQFTPSLWSVRDSKTDATAITPGKYNTSDINENIQKFHENDPHGFIIAVIAMLIVFSALILLYICFKLFGKVSEAATAKSAANAGPATAATAPAPKAEGTQDDEVIAAIGVALYLHLNAHDHESGILTFADCNTNNGWSAKSNMMRTLPKINK